LAPQFARLDTAFAAHRAKLSATASGLVPEEVIVLETVGPVDAFFGAVKRIRGMEWLGEYELEDIPPDDDFFAVDTRGERRPDKTLRGRLFMVFSDQDALNQMLSLRARWESGEKLPWGSGAWGQLFDQLLRVRTWSVDDRLLETGVLRDWEERAAQGEEFVPAEIELWYLHDDTRRRAAAGRVRALVEALQGSVIRESTIAEIEYHAILARLPIAGVEGLIRKTALDAELVQCEQIQFFRAAGQMIAAAPEDVGPPVERVEETSPSPGPPVVAVLDGLPIQAHYRLGAGVILDDPDDYQADYRARERVHGTAMASLILNGDLGSKAPALSRPIYLRPILKPDTGDWRERRDEKAPADELVVDLIHRAVVRLFEGRGTDAPVAPDVAIINLSIGIRDRPFDRAMSPLARLLDWLAWRYEVLFLVSAGNYDGRVTLDVSVPEYRALDLPGRQEAIIRAIAADARNRRLLSPAEAVNVLTVGAIHHDQGDNRCPPGWESPFVDTGLPSPINAQGMGHRRAIKPDLLSSGGRVAIRERLGAADPAEFEVYMGGLPPGQQVACPGTAEGALDQTRYTSGTSNATALASRAAALLYEVLAELKMGPGGSILESVPLSVVIKALLAHSSEWGTAEETLRSTLITEERRRGFAEYVTRLLGYGGIRADRVMSCTPCRVTAIGCGVLRADAGQFHEVPLPPSLSGKRGKRRLTATLAWMTPVNARHQHWRRAHLWFHPDPDRRAEERGAYTPLNLKRSQADWQATQRGTLQHEVFDGEAAAAYVDGSSIKMQVSCRADAGSLEGEVPYALALTLEVAEELGIPIYDEVLVRVQAARVRVTDADA
jgi:Subtilase family.